MNNYLTDPYIEIVGDKVEIAVKENEYEIEYIVDDSSKTKGRYLLISIKKATGNNNVYEEYQLHCYATYGYNFDSIESKQLIYSDAKTVEDKVITKRIEKEASISNKILAIEIAQEIKGITDEDIQLYFALEQYSDCPSLKNDTKLPIIQESQENGKDLIFFDISTAQFPLIITFFVKPNEINASIQLKYAYQYRIIESISQYPSISYDNSVLSLRKENALSVIFKELFSFGSSNKAHFYINVYDIKDVKNINSVCSAYNVSTLLKAKYQEDLDGINFDATFSVPFTISYNYYDLYATVSAYYKLENGDEALLGYTPFRVLPYTPRERNVIYHFEKLSMRDFSLLSKESYEDSYHILEFGMEPTKEEQKIPQYLAEKYSHTATVTNTTGCRFEEFSFIDGKYRIILKQSEKTESNTIFVLGKDYEEQHNFIFKYYTVSELSKIPTYEFDRTSFIVQRKRKQVSFSFKEVFNNKDNLDSCVYVLSLYHTIDFVDPSTVNTVYPNSLLAFKTINITTENKEETIEKTFTLKDDYYNDIYANLVAVFSINGVQELIAYKSVKITGNPKYEVKEQKTYYTNTISDSSQTDTFRLHATDEDHLVYEIEISNTPNLDYVFELYNEQPTYKNDTNLIISLSSSSIVTKTFIVQHNIRDESDILVSFYQKDTNELSPINYVFKYKTLSKPTESIVYSFDTKYTGKVSFGTLTINFPELPTSFTIKSSQYNVLLFNKEDYIRDNSTLISIDLVLLKSKALETKSFIGNSTGNNATLSLDTPKSSIFVSIIASFVTEDDDTHLLAYGIIIPNNETATIIITIVLFVLIILGAAFCIYKKVKKNKQSTLSSINEIDKLPLIDKIEE